MYKVGDKIILADDLTDPTSVREKTITKVGKDTVQCGSSEETYYTGFIWPASYRERVEEICRVRQALKKAYDDSISLVFQLRNEIVRAS